MSNQEQNAGAWKKKEVILSVVLVKLKFQANA